MNTQEEDNRGPGKDSIRLYKPSQIEINMNASPRNKSTVRSLPLSVERSNRPQKKSQSQLNELTERQLNELAKNNIGLYIGYCEGDEGLISGSSSEDENNSEEDQSYGGSKDNNKQLPSAQVNQKLHRQEQAIKKALKKAELIKREKPSCKMQIKYKSLQELIEDKTNIYKNVLWKKNRGGSVHWICKDCSAVLAYAKKKREKDVLYILKDFEPHTCVGLRKRERASIGN